VQFANGTAGVELLGAVSVGAGTNTPRAALLTGAKLFVRSGSSLDVQGDVVLGGGAALDVSSGANVQLTGACTGRTTNGATVTGAGAVNGTSIGALTCAP
jgi:hypothetical protein